MKQYSAAVSDLFLSGKDIAKKRSAEEIRGRRPATHW